MNANGYRLEARNALRGNWGMAAGTTLVAMLLGGVSSSSFEIEFESEASYQTQLMLMEALPYVLIGGIGAILISIFVSNVVSVGYNRFALNMIDLSLPEFKDLFSQFRKGAYKNAVVLNLLRGLFVFAWTLLFIIPGIIAEYSYAMASYILLDNPELTPIQCITASKRLMDGRKWDLFCLRISFFGWAFLSAFTFGIGDLFLCPYKETATAAFYRDITQGISIYDYL